MEKFEQEAIAVAQLSPDLFSKLHIVVKMFRKNVGMLVKIWNLVWLSRRLIISTE